MSNQAIKKLSKIIDITPDLDSVHIVGKISQFQIMESMDVNETTILVCKFTLSDETGSVYTRLQGVIVDILKSLNNEDVIEIKNGRIDVVDNRILLSNDIWSKISKIADKDFGNISETANISGIEYSIKSK